MIPVRDEQYPNVPDYVWGHNPRPTPPKPPNKPCLCGCGVIPKTPGRTWVNGHNNRGQKRSAETRDKLRRAKLGAGNPRYGKRPANYQGWQRHGNGYIQQVVPGHPFAVGRGSLVMEHRLVMESWLRENDTGSPYLVAVDGVPYLRPEIEVHHLNGVKDDNRVENLQCLTTSEHATEHQRLRREAKGAA